MNALKSFFAIVAIAFAQFAIAAPQPADDRTPSGSEIVSKYQEGLALIQKDGKFGFANRQGSEVVLPQYKNARMFQNGYAAVETAEGWTFINKQGQRITRSKYSWVGNFDKNGSAPVQRNGKWGLINEQGFEITALKYDAVRGFDENGQALARLNGRWYAIDVKGNETPAEISTNSPQAALEGFEQN